MLIGMREVERVARRVVCIAGDDFKYESCPVNGCAYVHKDPETHELSSGCIVGKVLEAYGVPLEDMLDIGSLHTSREEFEVRGVNFTDRAFRYLDTAQHLQDNGLTWDQATALASGLADRMGLARVAQDTAPVRDSLMDFVFGY